MTERRARRVVGQPRSTQRSPSPIPTDDELALRAFLRDFSRRRPRWGWRRAATAARKAGWVVNNKRIHRLWAQKACVCPIASGSGRSAASGWPSVRSAHPAQRRLGPRLPVRPDL